MIYLYQRSPNLYRILHNVETSNKLYSFFLFEIHCKSVRTMGIGPKKRALVLKWKRISDGKRLCMQYLIEPLLFSLHEVANNHPIFSHVVNINGSKTRNKQI